MANNDLLFIDDSMPGTKEERRKLFDLIAFTDQSGTISKQEYEKFVRQLILEGEIIKPVFIFKWSVVPPWGETEKKVEIK